MNFGLLETCLVLALGYLCVAREGRPGDAVGDCVIFLWVNSVVCLFCNPEQSRKCGLMMLMKAGKSNVLLHAQGVKV